MTSMPPLQVAALVLVWSGVGACIASGFAMLGLLVINEADANGRANKMAWLLFSAGLILVVLGVTVSVAH